MIEDGKKVSIEYTLQLDDGTTADTNVGGEPLVYEQGGNQILTALETALAGLDVNDTKSVKLSPEDGYGVHDPAALQQVEHEAIPEDARSVGSMLMAHDGSGGQRPVRVHEVQDDKIILDFNHPLAGQSLNFDVKVLAIE